MLRLFSLIFFLPLFLAGCSSNRSKLHFFNAERLWIRGQFEPAIREYEAVVELDPKSALAIQSKERMAYTYSYSIKQPKMAVALWEDLLLLPQISADQKSLWSLEAAWIYLEQLKDLERALSKGSTWFAEKPCERWTQFRRFVRGIADLGESKEAQKWLKKCRDMPEALLLEVQVVPISQPDGELEKLASKWVLDHVEAQIAGEIAFALAGRFEYRDEIEEAKRWLVLAERTHPNPSLIETKLLKLATRKKSLNK